MRKIILLAGLVAGGVAMSVTASANNWLLYLPAILAGSGGGTTQPPVTTESNNWLLFLPAILAGSQGGQPPVVTVPKFNDTGITECAENTLKEDCNYGRDVTVPDPDPSDGHAGFEFSLVTGGCIKDEVTGLVWSLDQGGDVWSGTSGIVNAANTGELCGLTAWRMPTIKELVSIVSYHTYSPAIDTNFFTNASTDKAYWSDTDVSGVSSKWTVNIYGATAPVSTSNPEPLSVRLVHD
ncbi:MAG: DUF1566 domain-containing protein [Candidatus Electrothrix communis]|nr:MAG: DUF1566 domain-containing protein [Candidatus Electrothrix communis]